jgi:hypothetical protein
MNGGGMPVVYDDGGRLAAGFKGRVDDCVCRAIAIASGRPYGEIYRLIDEAAGRERPRNGRQRSGARTGVRKATIDRVMADLGARWVATMSVGGGCHVHLRPGELPTGRLVARVSRHLVAVINGTVRDTSDPTRAGRRCVYGYWIMPE